MGFFPTAACQRQGATSPRLPKCGECGLAKQCLSPRMAPTGSGKRKVLFIAEAPGEQEDRQGTQLIGDAGQCLRKMLDSIGVDLEECWKTNAVICRPPGNKIESKHIAACRPNVLRTISELKPEVIILLGASAVESVLEGEYGGNLGAIGKWVGWAIPSPRHNAWVCPTYHPSYVKRQNEDPPLVRIVTDHLRRAFALRGDLRPSTPLEGLRAQIERLRSPTTLKTRLKGLLKAEGRLAFDYETTGLKPERSEQRIVAASFCLNGQDTFAGPVDPSVYPILSKVLLNPALRKIASNLKFEERWTWAKLGHGVAGWYWDTMLTAHYLDNRGGGSEDKHHGGGISSIKFQAFVHFGIGDYSSHIAPFLKSSSGANGTNRILDVPMDDLLLYNGLDSLLEFMVAEKQQEALR